MKRGGGADAGADAGADMGADMGADAGADDGERAWIAHVAALDAELARETRAAKNAAPGTPHAAVLPGSRGDDRTDDAPGVTTREVATAAIEHVRDALRNAVDSIEDAARANVAAHSAAASAGASASASKAATSPSTARTPATPARTPATPARTPATPATPSSGPSPQSDPRANRIVGLGSAGSRRRSRFAPSSPASPLATGTTTPGTTTPRWTTPRLTTPTTGTTTPRLTTPGSSTARGVADASGFRRTMSRLVRVKDETAALFLALRALAESESTEVSSPPTPGARAWFRRMRLGEADARTRDASAAATTPAASASRTTTPPPAEDASGADEDGVRAGVFARMREWARRVKRPPERRERSRRYADIAERHRNRHT